jgi:hypothetical protein
VTTKGKRGQAAKDAAAAQRQRDQDAHRSEAQARAQLDGVLDMVADLHPVECERCNRWHAEDADCDDARNGNRAGGDTEDAAMEDADQRISEDPLSVEVRSDWHTPGEAGEAEEYRILLCTGGPAVQIVGDIGGDAVAIEHQDWFTPWTPLDISRAEAEALRTYAARFTDCI